MRCRDGALYTGIATDIARRVAEHSTGNGKGAKSLRGKGPLEIVLAQEIGSRNQALRIESRIKKLSKIRKEELLGSETRFLEWLADAGEPWVGAGE